MVAGTLSSGDALCGVLSRMRDGRREPDLGGGHERRAGGAPAAKDEGPGATGRVSAYGVVMTGKKPKKTERTAGPTAHHGAIAEQVRELFHLTCRRLGLVSERYPELDTGRFRRPGSPEQPSLFDP